MPTTTSAFRNSQKEILGELAVPGQAPTYTDTELDNWRNKEIGLLYSRGLYKIASTRGLAGYTEPTIAADVTTGLVPRYFALPPLWRRVYGVEYVVTSTDEFIGKTIKFNDQEVPGFIRLYDIENYVGYNLRFVGEAEYTDLTDPYLRSEVEDVILYGTVLRALVSQYMVRIRAHRTAGRTRNQTDASAWHVASGIIQIRQLLKEAKANALNIQVQRTFAV